MSCVIINGRIESHEQLYERAAISEMSELALKMIKAQQENNDRAAASETTGDQAQQQGPDTIGSDQ